jgi:sphingolipid delta-4 desaturase
MRLTETEREHFLTLLRQPDNISFSAMLALTAFQLAMASTVDSFSLGFWFKILLIGAPISHSLYILNLEFANNLCFGHELLDRTSAIFSNFATTVPYAELVRYFDAEHRTFFDSTLYKDPEKPSQLEIQLVQGVGMKLLYLCVYPCIYSYRILFRHYIVFTRFLLWNLILQTLFNLYIWYCYGHIFFSYLFLSTYIGMSPWHPCAAHLLFQHQKCELRLKSAKAYSYYGIMNLFTFNIGYHRERHEHPKIPWSKLPLLRQLFYYAEYESHQSAYYTSTLQAIHDFIYIPECQLA